MNNSCVHELEEEGSFNAKNRKKKRGAKGKGGGRQASLQKTHPGNEKFGVREARTLLVLLGRLREIRKSQLERRFRIRGKWGGKKIGFNFEMRNVQI